MHYRYIVLLTSAVLAVIFLIIGIHMRSEVANEFDEAMAAQAQRFYFAYQVQGMTEAQRSQALAHVIANDEKVRHLLARADEAVQAEGGGAGKENAAAIRAMLNADFHNRWMDLKTRYEVQQVHFLLPNAISFLRMHSPLHYGDPLTEFRPLLDDVAYDLKSRSAFEAGNAYAGVRSAAPVIVHQPDGRVKLVGIIEAGFDMKQQLLRLGQHINADFALLLHNPETSGSSWDAENDRPTMGPGVVLAETSTEANAWLRAGLLEAASSRIQRRILPWQNRNYLLVSFNPEDYYPAGTNDSQQRPIGTLLMWRDITTRVTDMAVKRQDIIYGVLTAWIITQLCVLLALHFCRREWLRQLQANTATIQTLSRNNALLLDTAADGIIGVDKNGFINFINRAALMAHGYCEEEVMGTNPHQLLHSHQPNGERNPAKDCPITQTLEDGQSRESEQWLRRRDGSFFPVRMNITAINENGERQGVVIVFHDITEQKSRQEALMRLATTDSLTGAANRRQFLNQLASELARMRRHGGEASLLMTDLDYFKRINDNYGHAAGDAVLTHFVRIVHQTIRRSDMIGRVGGEEFAVLLPGNSINGAHELAERLRLTLENNPAYIGNTPLPVTVSIGISELSSEDVTADTPLRRADEALYRAKANGRNRTEINRTVSRSGKVSTLAVVQ